MVRHINWIQTNSTNIDQIGYREDEQKLFIKFKSRKKEEYYLYKSVDVIKFGEFMLADSKGKFLRAEIMPKYDYEKVEEE